jgi:hypothetical protein
LISPENLEQYAVEARQAGITTTEGFAEYCGVSPRTLFYRMREAGLNERIQGILKGGEPTAPPAPGNKITRTGTVSGDEIIESRGARVKTLEDLLTAAEVDLEAWRVRDYSVNAWESHFQGEPLTLHQVKARLERNQEATYLRGLQAAVIEEMKEHAPGPLPRLKPGLSELALEIAIPDLHLGKLAHAEETGANYDGKIAVAAFRHVLYQLLDRGRGMQIGRIIFPVGNDLLHVDGDDNATTGGTPQDTDSRWHRTTRRAVNLMVEGIDAMAQIAPVDVVVVLGNHARTRESMLGEIIRAWYRNEPRVRLHDSPAPRKYLQHGKTLLGFTHGDGPKAKDLPLIMATEAPDAWSATSYRTWAIGHEHGRRMDKFGSVSEDKGVEVRMSPSLSASDSWHTYKGYIGNLRAAEAFVHDAEAGEIARFRAVLPENFGGD